MATQRSSPVRRRRRLITVGVAAAASMALILTPAGAQGIAQIDGEVGDVLFEDGLLDDLDTRAGVAEIAPSAAQLAMVDGLGAMARWTPFGTAQSLIRHGEFLATDLAGADAPSAARAWLDDHRALYRLDSVDDLDVHADIALTDDARVVVFRQRIGGLPVSPEGFASIGLVGSADDGWSVAYASSTFVATEAAAGSMELTMREAYVEAADDAGVEVDVAEIAMGPLRAGWRVLDVDDIDQDQLIRRVAFPTRDDGVNAQAAGAGAVIVANNEPGLPFTMGGVDPTITIPSVMVALSDGNTIKAGLPATGTVASAPADPAPAQGRSVTIALDGEQTFRQAKASAMLVPGQNRFSALRQFELYACSAGNPANPTCDSSTDAGWNLFLRSHRDAFPGPNPRPTASDLILRSFQIPPTTATHVKFVVANNQCTGNPNFQGDQHNDPTSPTADCRSTTVGANEVRAAELQLLTSRPRVDGATLSD